MLFKDFFVQNFILICTGVVVVVNLIQHFNMNKRVSVYSIIILSLTFFLAISITFENHGKSISNIPLTTIFSVIGYVVRPIIVYLFILMSFKSRKQKWFYLTCIPLVINMLIYILAFIPTTKELVVYFSYAEEGDGLTFHGGPLRFVTHIVSGIFMLWWFYLLITRLRSKHLKHGITIMLCGAFVIIAVLIETFFNNDGDIFILNSTLGLSLLVYFLFAFIESTQIDSLTKLYNRSTYYSDIPKMTNTITGVIQFDLNGLKYLNDNFGHSEGDNAISTIASIIIESTNKKMYAYRMGGDEFLVVGNRCSEQELTDFISVVKERIDKTYYSSSIGYAYRKKKEDESFESLLKHAEEKMYIDKANYYKNNNIERRINN